MNETPKNTPGNNPDKKELNREDYLRLVNDFGMFLTLNASKLEQQIIPGKEDQLSEIREVLRKPIINGLNYSDFLAKHATELMKPVVKDALVIQMDAFLKYLEPRLSIFEEDSSWVEKFNKMKDQYSNLIK